MSSLRTIRRRIKSVTNIRDITRAMEMISAVRYKRIEQRLRMSQPYIENLKQAIARILSEELVKDHPLFEQRDTNKQLLLVMTGDRGLCGSYNVTVLKQVEKRIKSDTHNEISILPIGKIAIGYARRRKWPVYETMSNLGYKFSADSLRPIIEKLTQAFLSKKFDAIHMLSMKLARGSVSKPVYENYLNLRYLLETGPSETSNNLEYLFEPDPKSVLNTLLDLYVRQHFFTTLLGSITSEYHARMIAMKMATDNGKEIIKDLTLTRNKIRQAMITKEISEIIGGVNALN